MFLVACREPLDVHVGVWSPGYIPAKLQVSMVKLHFSVSTCDERELAERNELLRPKPLCVFCPGKKVLLILRPVPISTSFVAWFPRHFLDM